MRELSHPIKIIPITPQTLIHRQIHGHWSYEYMVWDIENWPNLCSLLVTSLSGINNTFTPLCQSTLISENWTFHRVTNGDTNTGCTLYMTHLYAIVYPGPVFYHLGQINDDNCHLYNIEWRPSFSFVIMFVHKNHRLDFPLKCRQPIIISSPVQDRWLVNTFMDAMSRWLRNLVVSLFPMANA